MQDVIGQALLDYQEGKYEEDITTFSSVAGRDRLSLDYLFRDFDQMPALEQRALELCRGTVLDIGCGAGNHALYLQQSKMDITGLDVSVGAIATCKLRGLKKTLNSTIYSLDGMKFDTLLLLMNGIGIAESLSNLEAFLAQLKELMKPGGQVLLDSSDIIYMFDVEEIDETNKTLIKNGQYYGEVTFTMEYKGYSSAPFNWLYLDYITLKEQTATHGLTCELIMEGEHYDYLARLSLGK